MNEGLRIRIRGLLDEYNTRKSTMDMATKEFLLKVSVELLREVLNTVDQKS
jgi:hypothetical protein